MKTSQSIISAGGLIGGLAVCTFTPASAIEPPPETAKPPAALLRESDRGNPDSAIAGNNAFLGIASAAVPGMVADHLGLTDGSGVVVRTVYPGSPADKAGIAVNDIITSLDGKPVPDPEALSSAIQDRKPGDPVEFGMIQKGKPTAVKVTLSKAPADATAQMEAEPLLDGIPGIHADRLRGLIEENLGGFNPRGLGAFPDAEFENTFRQMRERMSREFGNLPDAAPQGERGGFRFQSQNSSTIRLMDGDGSIEINSSDGDTQVKVRGKDNKVVWSGPWNSEADKDAAPKEIRERVDKVNSGSGSGFSFRFGRLRGAPDTIEN